MSLPSCDNPGQITTIQHKNGCTDFPSATQDVEDHAIEPCDGTGRVAVSPAAEENDGAVNVHSLVDLVDDDSLTTWMGSKTSIQEVKFTRKGRQISIFYKKREFVNHSVNYSKQRFVEYIGVMILWRTYLFQLDQFIGILSEMHTIPYFDLSSCRRVVDQRRPPRSTPSACLRALGDNGLSASLYKTVRVGIIS